MSRLEKLDTPVFQRETIQKARRFFSDSDRAQPKSQMIRLLLTIFHIIPESAREGL